MRFNSRSARISFHLLNRSKEMKALIDELRYEETHGGKQALEGAALKAMAEMANRSRRRLHFGQS